jgi:hypothetical protein
MKEKSEANVKGYCLHNIVACEISSNILFSWITVVV